MRILLVPVLALSLAALVGCGPMSSSPMPPRLSADDQKKIDESWDRALTPVDHLDRQALLDAFVVTQAYQSGVDRLTFRSEKKFAGGLVVMEIHFDRAKPDDDRFDVIVQDPNGKELRRINYTRPEIEATARDLFHPAFSQPRPAGAPPLDPEHAKKYEEIQKRLAAVQELFPKPDEPKPEK
jgi:hypothetical protein